MAVFIYEPDAFEKIVQIEGPDYPRNQENFGICSFEAFLAVWCELAMTAPSVVDPECYGRDWGLSVHDGTGFNNGAIYGWHGWHRYTVRYSGEIMFMSDFCPHRGYDILYDNEFHPGCEPLARKLGFRIFPDDLH